MDRREFLHSLISGDSLGDITRRAARLIKAVRKGSRGALAALVLVRCQSAQSLRASGRVITSVFPEVKFGCSHHVNLWE